MRYNWIGSRTLDYTLHTLDAVRKAKTINQGDLSEAVWGTSGRGNSTLTQVLFPYCVSKGYMVMTKRGNAKTFSLTQKGLDTLNEHGACPQ